jgi:outer membrane protein TolC
MNRLRRFAAPAHRDRLGSVAASARRGRVAAAVVVTLIGLAAEARAQQGLPQQPVPLTLRGVPAGSVRPEPVALTLADAIDRGLKQNLSAILEEQRLRNAQSTRLEALSELLPHVSAYARQTEQKISTAAFGFDFPGVPRVIGPFGVFDSRLALTTPIFDARALSGFRAGRALERAGRADLREVRETIVLAVGNLYLEAEADAARVESARAQVATAETLVRLASDQKASGLVAGIDVVRQQVQLQSARQRLIAAENTLDKRKLALARAIGLPSGQALTLTSETPFRPAPPMTIDQAVAEATAARQDVQAAQARVDAARFAKRAQMASRLPSLHLDADLGVTGTSASDTDKVYTVAATVRVPLFEGGQTRARVQRADTELKTREAELADITGSVRYDVEGALLDIKAADAGVGVAEGARTLARQELEQAQDRFKAGVASTLELVQAQEAVAAASEQYIASVYAHAIAKGELAKAIGQVEQRFVALVGGAQ